MFLFVSKLSKGMSVSILYSSSLAASKNPLFRYRSSSKNYKNYVSDINYSSSTLSEIYYWSNYFELGSARILGNRS